MKDFQLRNDTKLLFRNNPVEDLSSITKGKRVLFVYGGGSVKENGCYEDVKSAVVQTGGMLYEAGNSSRERMDIELGIRIAKENKVELVIGAGGRRSQCHGLCQADCVWRPSYRGFMELCERQKDPYKIRKTSAGADANLSFKWI